MVYAAEVPTRDSCDTTDVVVWRPACGAAAGTGSIASSFELGVSSHR
jgi:hypothetical protein